MSTGGEGARDDRARAEAEEQAWRDIVDHYGERAIVPEDEPEVEPQDVPEDLPEGLLAPEPEPVRMELYDDSFTPPPLPPPPVIAPGRRAAWVGLVAPPVLLLVVVALAYPLPSVLSGGLVVAFLASFGYLVATMDREPRDPDDDGARL